jgi:hypothetical protein
VLAGAQHAADLTGVREHIVVISGDAGWKNGDYLATLVNNGRFRSADNVTVTDPRVPTTSATGSNTRSVNNGSRASSRCTQAGVSPSRAGSCAQPS